MDVQQQGKPKANYVNSFREGEAEQVDAQLQSKPKANDVHSFRDGEAEQVDVQQQSKPKAGPFGPVGSTNAAFLKYFDPRKAAAVKTAAAAPTAATTAAATSIGPSSSVPVDDDCVYFKFYRRSCDPDPDEQVSNL